VTTKGYRCSAGGVNYMTFIITCPLTRIPNPNNNNSEIQYQNWLKIVWCTGAICLASVEDTFCVLTANVLLEE